MFVIFNENKIIEKYVKTFYIKDVLYFLTSFHKNEIVTEIKIKNSNNIKYTIDYDCLELYKGVAKKDSNLFFDKIIPTNICNLLEINFNYNGILELELTIITIEQEYINELLNTNCFFIDIKYNTILELKDGKHIIKKYSDNYKIIEQIKYGNLDIIEIESIYDNFIDIPTLQKIHNTYKDSIIKSHMGTNILINNIEKDDNLYKIYFFPVIYKTFFIKDISVISPINVKSIKIIDIELKEDEYLNFSNNSFLFCIEIESQLSGFQIYDIITNNAFLTFTCLSLNNVLGTKLEHYKDKIITLDKINNFNKLRFYSFFF